MCLTVRLLKRAISLMPRFFLSPVFKDYEPWRVCFCAPTGFGLFVQSENASLADKQVLRSLHSDITWCQEFQQHISFTFTLFFFSRLMVPVSRRVISQGCAWIAQHCKSHYARHLTLLKLFTFKAICFGVLGPLESQMNFGRAHMLCLG